jgi:arylsulfatase A-like enzyme
MTDHADTSAADWKGLGLSLLLALAFLGGCLSWMVRAARLLFANDGVTAALSAEHGLGKTLLLPLIAFGAAVVFLHALLGLLAFASARLTELAFRGRTIARRNFLIAGWFSLLAGIVLATNTTLYPASTFASETSWWRSEFLGLHPIAWVCGGLVLIVVCLAMRAAPVLRVSRPAHAVAAVVALFALATFIVPSRLNHASVPLSEVGGAPNVILIGIDSLRNDLTVPRLGPASAPAIRSFLGEARRFNDAVSPLARTYGAWVTILTGRHPVTTNARVNLMPRRLVHEGDTLADALRANGYHAVYATDEVRFANFDRSYGFDELITPPVGAADFLLGYAGDLPLVNLAVASDAGNTLFPSNYANRADSVTYKPQQFVRRLDRALDIKGPTFLAIHLTLAHWPYSWAGLARPSVPDAYRSTYGKAVSEVDRQFGDVLTLLGEKHLLDNAIVVLLSDHGEALGGQDDSMLRQTGTSREIWDSLWGHGTSVMSAHQYHVVLAMRAFGRARLPGPQQNYDWPVSLEDLRPTLEEYATGKPPTRVDGISLLPFLANPGQATRLATRVRFTETDFNTPATLAGHYEEVGIINEAAVYYELDRKSGWVQFKASRLPELLAGKQRAAMSSDTLLAAIPGPPGRGFRYLLVGPRDRVPRSLSVPPDPTQEPEAWRLWNALKARFPGELAPVPDVP